jgi:hypothetical protein
MTPTTIATASTSFGRQWGAVDDPDGPSREARRVYGRAPEGKRARWDHDD